MTYEEAKEQAKVTVYVYYTFESIISACRRYNIPVKTKSGKQICRSTLEHKLIEAMAREMSDSND